MQDMQDTILAAIAGVIEEKGLTAVKHAQWANTGSLHGMDGLATIVHVDYGFQHDYCTLTLGPDGVDLARAGFADSPPTFRVENDRIAFHHVQYTDGVRLQLVTGMVGQLVEAFRDQANGDG